MMFQKLANPATVGRHVHFVVSISMLALLLALQPTVGQAQVELAREGKAIAPILHGPGAHEKRAASRLAAYLGKMSGAAFDEQRDGDDAPSMPSPSIIIRQDADLSPNSAYRVRTQDGRLLITGGGEYGLHYAVYDLLEREFGCMFFSFDEEEIPLRRTLSVPETDRAWTPPFLMHDQMNREAQSRANDFHFKSRAVSFVQFTGNHTLYPLLNAVAATNQAFYPMDRHGARKGNNLHFCYLAPGIAEALAEALSREVEKRKGDVKHHIYFAGMGDAPGGTCQCEPCKTMVEQEAWTDPDGRKKPGYTATLLTMMNRAAELLEAKYPGIVLGTFAYMSLEAPPASVTPRHNVVVQVPRLRHCTVHPAETCSRNASFMRNLERWTQIAPGNVHVWDYGANYNNFLYPFPCIKAISENIRTYHRLGVTGLLIQGNYSSFGSDMVVLKNWVWSHLMADPAASPEALLDTFTKAYYGPAAPAVQRYLARLQAIADSPRHADEFANMRTYLTMPVIEELGAILEEGLAAIPNDAGNDAYRRRTRELWASVETALLGFTEAGPLIEADGKLIRQDLGGDTYPRARALEGFSRGNHPTHSEHGAGRAYWLFFYGRHGGPMAWLRQGDLEARVTPTQRGRIGPVKYKGRTVMLDTDDHPVVYWGEFTEPPTAVSATTFGESGLGSWQSLTQHIGYRAATLTDSRTLELASSIRKAHGRAAASVETKAITRYPYGASTRVEWQGEGDPWQTFTPGKSLETGPLAAVRIHMPDAGVTLEDSYMAMDAHGMPVKTGLSGQIRLDEKQKCIVVVWRCAGVAAPGGSAPGEYLWRTIRIEDR